MRQTDHRSAGFTVRTPTTMSSPASDGMARLPTTSPKTTMTTAMTRLVSSRARRDAAPACLRMAVAESEPPTGMPWNTPAATFATPWPEKSRDVSG